MGSEPPGIREEVEIESEQRWDFVVHSSQPAHRNEAAMNGAPRTMSGRPPECQRHSRLFVATNSVPDASDWVSRPNFPGAFRNRASRIQQGTVPLFNQASGPWPGTERIHR